MVPAGDLSYVGFAAVSLFGVDVENSCMSTWVLDKLSEIL